MAGNTPPRNLAATMKKHALTLHECRVSPPVEPLWGRPYRMVEWVDKSDPSVRRLVVAADSTTAEIADVLKSHVPGRRYGTQEDE